MIIRTKLTGPAFNQKATPISESYQIQANIAVVSLGFKGNLLPGLPFNDRLGVLHTKYLIFKAMIIIKP